MSDEPQAGFESRGVSRRAAVLAVAAVVVAAVVVAALVGGAVAVRGVLVGGVLGAAFVAAGPWLIEPIVRSSPSAAVPAAVALFIGKAMVAVAVLLVIDGSEAATDWLSLRALVLTLVAVVVVAINLQLVDFLNRRSLTYDLDRPAE